MNSSNIRAISNKEICVLAGLKVYLKKLRLHKYSATFLKYSYEEFLSLNDEILKLDGVTLGARGKILKSIEKIHRRPEKLRDLLTSIEVCKANKVSNRAGE